jgi:hypothetical protein
MRVDYDKDQLAHALANALRERDEAREENAKLRDIAERAIVVVFHKTTEDILRAELDQLKEGAK